MSDAHHQVTCRIDRACSGGGRTLQLECLAHTPKFTGMPDQPGVPPRRPGSTGADGMSRLLSLGASSELGGRINRACTCSGPGQPGPMASHFYLHSLSTKPKNSDGQGAKLIRLGSDSSTVAAAYCVMFPYTSVKPCTQSPAMPAISLQ